MPKEQAENLMIVDLIRHDLHSVVGPGNVRVPKLMVVEEYAMLFQLVTVVEGILYTDDDYDDGDAASPMNADSRAVDEDDGRLSDVIKKPPGLNGIDVLAASLAPSSMTGAQKRRSCSILQTIEGRNRGVYSGVLGYMDVGGGGDFSVVIRSAFSWDTGEKSGYKSDGNVDSEAEERAATMDKKNDADGAMGNIWTIGAGGAVTFLSTEDGEWEEMSGKLASTLDVFTDVS